LTVSLLFSSLSLCCSQSPLAADTGLPRFGTRFDKFNDHTRDILPCDPLDALRPWGRLTSTTKGPRLERRVSTPATFRPMVRAERIAVVRSSDVILTRVALPPRWILERNSPHLVYPAASWRTLPCPQSRNSGYRPLRLLDELLDEHAHLQLQERLDHALSNALGTFEQLDNQRRSPDHLDKILDIVRLMGKAGDRQPDPFA
jgi:hypothetical protein